MKITHQTYQQWVKAVAVLLLAALFVPAGLHAKQLVDFCKPSPIEQPMAADHSCCDEPDETNDQYDTDENENSDAHQNHNCDWGIICACNVSLGALNDTEWIIVNNNVVLALTDSKTLLFQIPSSDPIHFNQQLRIGQHKPPLWLLYDTYLI